jgi:hypothetical protein
VKWVLLGYLGSLVLLVLLVKRATLEHPAPSDRPVLKVAAAPRAIKDRPVNKVIRGQRGTSERQGPWGQPAVTERLVQ